MNTTEIERRLPLDLGYKPSSDVVAEMRIMLKDLIEHKGRIEAKRDALIPDVRWDGTRQKSKALESETVRQP